MEKVSLVASDIAEGRRFAAALERAGLPVAVAMWFRKAGAPAWMLGIATPNVQTQGPLAVIRFADGVRRDGFEGSISREDLVYFNPSEQFLADMGPFLRAALNEVQTVENLTLNGSEIEKALIFHAGRDLPLRDGRPPRAQGGRNRRRVA